MFRIKSFVITTLLIVSNLPSKGQWSKAQNLGTEVYCISMANDSVGVIGTLYGAHRTGNGWKSKSLCGKSYDYIQDISLIDEHIFYLAGFEVGASGFISTAVNGCGSLDKKSGASSIAYDFVYTRGFDTVFTNLDGINILRTFDGGKNYDTIPLDTNSGFFKFIVGFGNKLICGISNNRAAGYNLYFSSDLGDSWTKVSRGDEQFMKVQFISERKILSVTRSGEIKESLDEGRTWKDRASPTNLILHGIKFMNADTGFVYGGDHTKGVIYRTFDGGTSWDHISPIESGYITDIWINNNGVGFATDLDGAVFKTANFGGPAVPDTISEKPNDTSSFVGKNSLNERDILIYPNPGNGVLNVQLQHSSIDAGKVELRDIRGRILSVHEIDRDLLEINTSKLSSGMYFLHFDTTEGSFLRRWVKE